MYLTHDDKELTVGNYIADFIRNRDMVMFSDRIVDGIKLHRFIDQYTDMHPEVLKSTRKLRKRHGKYAPVVIDIFYDYILSMNWESFTDFSKRTFADKIYGHINEFSYQFPIHLQDISAGMIAGDFLLQYGRREGIIKTFQRLSRRAKFDSNFETAFEDLERDYDEINEGFLRFFPDLIDEVEKFEFE